MKKVSVQLKTGGHCIQTSARNELRKISDAIMFSGNDEIIPGMAEQYKLLEDFLNHTDFNKLRASDERFAGIIEAVCTISRSDDGQTVIEVTG